MHQTQKKLLELSQTHNFQSLSLREIGKLIGEYHPQNVKYHLGKIGVTTSQNNPNKSKSKGDLLPLPVLGYANCGAATALAESGIKNSEYLHVSKKLFPRCSEKIFAVEAIGNSMNRASIAGQNIEPGDYAIVDPMCKNVTNGDYVVSVINGMANIKRFFRNQTSGEIALVSESDKNYPPYYIHPKDSNDYIVSGKVVSVLKRPQFKNEDGYAIIPEF